MSDERKSTAPTVQFSSVNNNDNTDDRGGIRLFRVKKKGEGIELKKGYCWACKRHPVTYECHPCGHKVYCTTCAYKVATGGKCKQCREFFAGLRQIRN